MTCEQFAAQLTAFSMGELEPGLAADAREHVHHCPGCAAAMLRERELVGLLQAAREPSAAGLQQKVMTTIRAELAKRERRRWVFVGVGAAAAVLIAILAVELPQRDSSSALAAAWTAYRAGPLVPTGAPDPATAARLRPLLGSWPGAPDLSGFNLRTVGWGSRSLAGRESVAVEYRATRTGSRVALFRWKGGLPEVASGGPDGNNRGEVLAAQWGSTGALWWQERGVVWCLVGTVEPATLEAVGAYLRGPPS